MMDRASDELAFAALLRRVEALERKLEDTDAELGMMDQLRDRIARLERRQPCRVCDVLHYQHMGSSFGHEFQW